MLLPIVSFTTESIKKYQYTTRKISNDYIHLFFDGLRNLLHLFIDGYYDLSIFFVGSSAVGLLDSCNLHHIMQLINQSDYCPWPVGDL